MTSETGFTTDSDDVTCTDNTCTATTAGTYTITATHSGITTTAELTVTPAAADYLTLTPPEATITAGQIQDYAATSYDQYDNLIGDVTSETGFTTDSDDVTCTDNTCTSTTAGTYTITATHSGITTTAELTVTPAAADYLTLTPPETTITAGQTQDYAVTSYDQYDNLIGDVTTDTELTTTGDASCADGSCTSTTAGTYTITATHSGITTTAELTVTPAAADYLTLTPPETTITAGQTQDYAVTSYDQYDNLIGDVTTDTELTTTGDASCADGSCTSTTAGTYTITATHNEITTTAELTVTPAAADYLTITPPETTITAGQTQDYAVTSYDQYDNLIGDVTTDTDLTTTGDASCADGSCTATTAGTYTITATHNGTTTTSTLTVTPAAADYLTLSPPETTITAGDTQDYAATSYDQYDNLIGDVTTDTDLTTTGDASCADGSCTATTAGTYTITATHNEITTTAELTVTPAAADYLTITPPETTITAGQTQDYAVTSYDQYDNLIGDVTTDTDLTTTGDASCADGSCTSTTAGTYTITATHSGITTTAELTVTPAAADYLTITPPETTITAGQTQDYAVTSYDQYDNLIGDVTTDTELTTTGDASCADGSCTSTTAGTYTITATHNEITTTAELTVTPAAADYLTITPPETTITAGQTQDYAVTSYDQYDNLIGDVTTDTELTTTGDASCADGSCTATTAGTYTITATHNGTTTTSTLTVTPAAADYLTLSPPETTITAGDTQDYAATSYDQYDNLIGDVTTDTDLTTTGDASCADGSCTATTAGTYTITATHNEITTTATLTVTAVTPEPAAPPAPPLATTGADGTVIAGMAAVVLLLGGGIIMASRRWMGARTG